MRLVLSLSGAAPPEIVEAQVAFQLHTGVDLVVVDSAEPAVRDVLSPYAGEGVVALVSGSAEVAQAVAAFAPDWLVAARAGEFWWPRAGTLAELLAAVPSRYGTIRALVRDVPLLAGDDLVERMVVRCPGSPVTSAELLPAAERQRAGDSSTTLPLRSWYPVEALRVRDAVLSAEQVAQGLAGGSLVPDTRLSTILGRIRDGGGREGRAYLLPTELGETLELPLPAVTDDAEYAVEVAALGEAAPVVLGRQIEELAARVDMLESGFLRRLGRRVARSIAPARST